MHCLSLATIKGLKSKIMKAGCSLDLFFTNNFFPFDLWIWISLIKSSSDFLWLFSLSPAPTATLVFVVFMTSLFSCLILCAGLTVSHFFSSYSIHNSLLSSNLPPSPVALPAAPLVPPVTSGSFAVCSGARLKPSPTGSQLPWPKPPSLPYAFSLFRSP